MVMLGTAPPTSARTRSRKRLLSGGILAVLHIVALLALANGTLLQRLVGGVSVGGMTVALIRLHRPRGMPWYVPFGVCAGLLGGFLAFDVGAAAVDDGPPERTTWERSRGFAVFLAGFGVVALLTLTWSGLGAVGFAAGDARDLARDRLTGEIVHEISLDQGRKLLVALDTSDGRREASALMAFSEARPFGDVWKTDDHPFAFPSSFGSTPEPGEVSTNCVSGSADPSYCVIVGPATASSFVTEINGVPVTIQANQGVGVLIDDLDGDFVNVDGGEPLGEIRVG